MVLSLRSLNQPLQRTNNRNRLNNIKSRCISSVEIPDDVNENLPKLCTTASQELTKIDVTSVDTRYI